MGKFIDLTGRSFGRLTVLKRAGNRRKATMWLCRCDCGAEKLVYSSNLIRGGSQSCGCLSAEMTSLNLTKDITGRRFGKLTVIERCGSKRHQSVWLCQCECGGSKKVTGHALKAGHVSSCGCMFSQRRKTHGMSGTRLYRIWGGMRSRCNDKNAPLYKYYGGRGITVCGEWESFTLFFEWSMCNGYNDALSIDRIDNNKGYSPNNCRWVTKKEQARNTRNLKLFYAISPIGRRYIVECQTQFAEEQGMKPHTIHNALAKGCKPKNGWRFQYAKGVYYR